MNPGTPHIAWNRPIVRTQLATSSRPGWGFTYVLAVPFLAAIAPLRGLDIAEFNYSGLLWTSAFVMGVLLLAVERILRPEHRSYFPATPWVLWLAFAAFSLSWTEILTYIEVQDAVQLSMPVLVGIVASVFVRTRQQLDQVVRAYFYAVPVLCFFVLLWGVGILGHWEHVSDGSFLAVSVRVIAYTAVVIGALAITGAKRNFWLAWTGWGICMAITVVTGSRMASGAMLLLPILNPITRNPLKKAAAIGVIMLVGLAAFSTPTIQQRFFNGEEAGLDRVLAGDFDDAGRLEVWPLLLEEALQRPWFGHGMGSVQTFLPEVWPNSSPHAHNEYLRLGFELGYVGLLWFLGVVFWQLWDLGRWIRRSDGVLLQVFAAAWLGLAVFLPIAFTDNPLVLNLFYMDPVFALIGAAYTVAREEEIGRAQSTPTTPQSRFRGLPRPTERVVRPGGSTG